MRLAEIRVALSAKGPAFGIGNLWRFFERRRITLKKDSARRRARPPRHSEAAARMVRGASSTSTLGVSSLSHVEACKRVIEQVDDAERQVSGEYRSPKGGLAVTTPWGIGHRHLLPIAIEFLEAFPAIGMRLLLTNRLVDTVEENIDVALRIGSLPENSMIVTPIGTIRLVVCASPAYLAVRGRSKIPDQLRDHDCIAVNDAASPNAWKFRKGHRASLVPIQSRLCVNTSEAAVLAAVAGAGLTRVMSYKMTLRGVRDRLSWFWRLLNRKHCRFPSSIHRATQSL